jgi:hypothetical protein
LTHDVSLFFLPSRQGDFAASGNLFSKATIPEVIPSWQTTLVGKRLLPSLDGSCEEETHFLLAATLQIFPGYHYVLSIAFWESAFSAWPQTVTSLVIV